MARVPFPEYDGRWNAFATQSLALHATRNAELAERDALIATLGLPDDQVPAPPVDDTALTEFATQLAALGATGTPDPGDDIDVDGELPDIPDPVEPAPVEPAPVDPTLPGTDVPPTGEAPAPAEGTPNAPADPTVPADGGFGSFR